MGKIVEFLVQCRRNKHTTAAGLVCIAIGVCSAVWPKCEPVWRAIFKAAAGYGFLMGMDARRPRRRKKRLDRHKGR